VTVTVTHPGTEIKGQAAVKDLPSGQRVEQVQEKWREAAAGACRSAAAAVTPAPYGHRPDTDMLLMAAAPHE
jgi:hypothetical protein